MSQSQIFQLPNLGHFNLNWKMNDSNSMLWCSLIDAHSDLNHIRIFGLSVGAILYLSQVWFSAITLPGITSQPTLGVIAYSKIHKTALHTYNDLNTPLLWWTFFFSLKLLPNLLLFLLYLNNSALYICAIYYYFIAVYSYYTRPKCTNTDLFD